MSRSRPWIFASVAMLVTSSCTDPGESESAESTREPSAQVDEGFDAAQPTIVVTANPDNTLSALVSIAAETPTNVIVSITSPETTERTLSSASPSTSHDFVVVGLRAETAYDFEVATVSETGETATSSVERATFVSGALPPNAPSVEIVQAMVEPSESDGITVFGVPIARGETVDGPNYFGVDSDGFVVWYLESDGDPNRDPVARGIDGGEILTFSGDSIARSSLGGEMLETRDLSSVTQWHHDAILLPNGNTLALGRIVETVGGNDVQGDVIVELDPSGSIVWEWSTFDHLDVTRFPGPLSQSQGLATGATDWTHANSLFFDEATGQILLSVRSQHWVVAIDRESSDIAWIAGESTGIASDFNAPFLELESGTWMSAQHAATLTAAGELLIYDNRNETGGEDDFSRAVIYEIDGDALIANQVFEFVVPKYTASLGDIDELANGNLLITAGGPGSSDQALIIEVSRSGETVWQGALDGRLYRSERLTWAQIDGRLGAATSVAEPETDGASIDITNARLTSIDASCENYVGSYVSEVADVQTGREFAGDLTISADGDTCTLTSNQIPNHDIGIDANFANEAGEVESAWTIPVTPQLEDEPTDLGFTVHAVMLNGVIWEAYPAACFGEGPGQLGREAIGCGPNQLDNPWRYNVGSPLNVFQLDAFSAHAQGDGLYHYHSTPQALYEIECNGIAESPVIGFARDGFPIYGPCFTDDDGTIRAAQSSFQLLEGERQNIAGFTTPSIVGNVVSDTYNGQFIGDYDFIEGSGDLDECNGMVIDGVYGYYITDQYPYVLSCFSGTPSTSFGAAGR